MKILFAKTFGIGNAVMAIPTIKALKSLGHEVDVLIGTLPDDAGAVDVFTSWWNADSTAFHACWHNFAPLENEYDLAILSIPFDGRWQNGVHFRAKQTMDGRTRPDPSTTGLVSWKKHEVEYQMDNARALGYQGDVPDCSFLKPEEWALRPNVFYLGVGYKKDAAGFWKVKHWGNQKYAELVKLILDENRMNIVVTSGDMADLQLSINPISQMVNDPRFQYHQGGIRSSFNTVARADMYIGNDSGMMHVAASCGNAVVATFALENSITKSRPWCKNYRALDGFIKPKELYDRMQELRCQT